MKGMRKVRSEPGILALAGGECVALSKRRRPSSIAPATIAHRSLPARRKGISAAEKLCMRRFPALSPEFAAKVACWSANVTPEGSSSKGSSPTAQRASAVRLAAAVSNSGHHRRQGGQLQQLELMEESCDKILQRIYPSSVSAASLEAEKPQHETATPLCETPTAAAEVALDGISLMQADMRLIRRSFSWDPAVASPIGDNAVRLIQGAAATRFNFESKRRSAVYAHRVSKEGKLAKAEGFDMILQFSSLHALRRKVLEKFSSVQAAFNFFDVVHDNHLDKREWCAVLSSPDSGHLCSLGEARVIYDLMDADHDGCLTPIEFQIGIEIIAPVYSMEAMRKRLVCLGFRTVKQAIAVMDGGGTDTTTKPLILQEFAAALRRVWIIEPDEHRAIFAALRDPTPSDEPARVSLGDLACGLAVVSPCLILEELRDQLRASARRALDIHLICPEEGIDLTSFQNTVCRMTCLSRDEAAKAFNNVDLDGSGLLSRGELRRALELAAPSLHLESCRRKIRQSFRSIEIAFQEAYGHPEEVPGTEARFTAEEFVQVLQPLELGEKNIKELVRLMASDSSGRHRNVESKLPGADLEQPGVTLKEFFGCARLFAPSCVVEGLKLQLLQVHGRLEDAFQLVKDRRAVLSRKGFYEFLQGLQVQADETQANAIFDFLDIRSANVVIASEVIAALQCQQPGRQMKLSPTECKSKVEQRVHQIFAPMRKCASELRSRVREEVKNDEENDALADHGYPLKVSQLQDVERGIGMVHQHQHEPDTLQQWLQASQERIPRSVLSRRTFQKIKSSLEPLGQKSHVLELGSYFVTQQDALSSQSIIGQAFNQVEEFRAFEELRRGALPAASGAPQFVIEADPFSAS